MEKIASTSNAPSLVDSRANPRTPRRGVDVARVVFWGALAATLTYSFGPSLYRQRHLPDAPLVDLFQDWASARQFQQGLKVYPSQREAAARYLGLFIPPDYPLTVEVNAHPPSAIALALPLSRWAFPTAYSLWFYASLAMLLGSIHLIATADGGRPRWWWIAPLWCFLLLPTPLRQHLYQGQWSLLILLLLVIAWRLERAGQPIAAGASLGTATAIKFFPGLLLPIVALRGSRRAAASGIATFLFWNLLAATLFGWSAFETYRDVVMPALARFHGYALNVSLTGCWTRCWQTQTADTGITLRAVCERPSMIKPSVIVSTIAVGAIACWINARASGKGRDHAFGAGVTAALLISPITWDHSLLIALLPLALIAMERAREGTSQWPCWIAMVGLMTPTTFAHDLWRRILTAMENGPASGQWEVTPIEQLCLIDLPTWTLLGLFVALTRRACRTATERPRFPADGAHAASLPSRTAP